MKYPLVSIVVPSFNQAHYLPAALDSVMYQEYPNLEIIICNHGSTDNTSEVIRDFMNRIENEEVSYLSRVNLDGTEPVFERESIRRYPKGRSVIVIESTENIGGTASYNEGFKRATGKYCTYLVGDDYFQSNAVSEMVAVLENEDVDFVYADMVVVDDSGHILQRLSKPEYSFERCFCDWFHLGVCRLYRRELHQRSGFYDTEYRNANDYDMYLRFAMDGCRFRHIPRVLYYTRKHDQDNTEEPASWRSEGYLNLLNESVECARRAREFAVTCEKETV